MTYEKPNLLWLSHTIPYPPKTGVLQRSYNLLREASRTANIYLLAIHKSNVLPIDYDVEKSKRELLKFCKHIEIVYLPIENSKILWIYTALKSLVTRDPFAINWIKSRRFEITLKAISSLAEIDIVHYDTISLAHYFPTTTPQFNVLNHHNIESHLMARRVKIERNPLKRFYYDMEAKKLRKYETECCGKFNLNFTVSELDKATLLRLNPNLDIAVVPNGVDIDYFSRNDADPKKGKMIFAGGMNWYPNRDAAIFLANEIWPLIKARYENVSLTIAGAEPPAEILDLASKDERIEVTGFVPDIRPYFTDAEIYLCPMRDGGGTRLKILDTLSMETALVSTTMGCEGIDVTDGENVLLADSPEEFVRQVGRILDEPQLRKSLVKNGRKLVEEKYSWDVIGKKLDGIYSTIMRDTKTGF